MKNPKHIFSLCLLLASLILTGCADSAQNPKSSEEATTSAISTTSSAINASSSAMQPVDPLSIEGQLKPSPKQKIRL